MSSREILDEDTERQVSAASAKLISTLGGGDKPVTSVVMEFKNKKGETGDITKNEKGKHVEEDDLSDTSLSDEDAFELHYYQCDECGKHPLRKVRYHCNVCDDFDLCRECKDAKSTVHPKSHEVTPVAVPDSMTLKSILGLPLTGIAGKETVDDFKRESPVKAEINKDVKAELKEDVKAVGKEDTDASKEETTKDDAKEDDTRPLRRRKNVSSLRAAGASMDQTNELLQQCDIPFLNTSSLSTRSSDAFLNCIEVAKAIFQSRHGKLEMDSVEGQIIALNGLALCGIQMPQLQRTKKFKPYKPLHMVSSKLLISVLVATIEQYKEADVENWFSAPVPSNVEKYYEVVKDPMDLETLGRKILAMDYKTKSPSQLFQVFRDDLRRIWKNAQRFNEDDSSINIAAKWFDQVTTQVLEQTATQLGIAASVSPEKKPPVFSSGLSREAFQRQLASPRASSGKKGIASGLSSDDEFSNSVKDDLSFRDDGELDKTKDRDYQGSENGHLQEKATVRNKPRRGRPRKHSRVERRELNRNRETVMVAGNPSGPPLKKLKTKEADDNLLLHLQKEVENAKKGLDKANKRIDDLLDYLQGSTASILNQLKSLRTE